MDPKKKDLMAQKITESRAMLVKENPFFRTSGHADESCRRTLWGRRVRMDPG